MCKQEDNILQSGNDEASHRWINLKQMEQSKNQKKKQKASKKQKKQYFETLWGESQCKKNNLEKT